MIKVRRGAPNLKSALNLSFGINCAVIAFFMIVSSPSSAQQSTFTIQSMHKKKVQIAFYSQTRSGHVWPGSGRAYNLDDYGQKTFNLSCQYGEKICFGAWETGASIPHWGVGPNDEFACTSCCVTCGNSYSTKLNDASHITQQRIRQEAIDNGEQYSNYINQNNNQFRHTAPRRSAAPYCRSPIDYNACKSPSQGHAEYYCRQQFC